MALQDEFNKGRRSVRRSTPSRGRRFVDPRVSRVRPSRTPTTIAPPPTPSPVSMPRNALTPTRPLPTSREPYTPTARYTALSNAFNAKLNSDPTYTEYQTRLKNVSMTMQQNINQLLAAAGLPPMGQETSGEQLAAQRRIAMQYNNSPDAVALRQQMTNLTTESKNYIDTTYASDFAALREEAKNIKINPVPASGRGGLGAPIQANPAGFPFGTGQPISTTLGNSMFNQDANYVIKGNSLYKDGKFLGNINGGMMGGGRAGENRIVMGNDAVVDVPDWVFETAERQEPDPVVTTPSTSTVSPKGPLYDIMTGGLGSSSPKDVIPRPKPSVNPGINTTKKPPRKKPTGTPKAPVKTKPVGGTKPKPKAVPKGTETKPAVKGVMSPKSPKLRTPPKPEVNVGKAPTRPTGRTPSTRGPNSRPRPSVRQGLSTPRTKPPSTNSKEFNPMNDRNKKSNTKPRNTMGMAKGGMAVKSNFGSNDFRTTGTTISVVDNRKKK